MIGCPTRHGLSSLALIALLTSHVAWAAATASEIRLIAFSSTASTAFEASAATLARPTGVTATVGPSQVAIAWTASISEFATGYEVHRATSPGGPYTKVGSVEGLASLTYTDKPPAAGTYYYVVRAVCRSWRSVDSNEVSATLTETVLAVP